MEKCRTCKFMNLSLQNGPVCRRYPPCLSWHNIPDKIGIKVQIRGNYPPTEHDGWCGEYQAEQKIAEA